MLLLPAAATVSLRFTSSTSFKLLTMGKLVQRYLKFGWPAAEASALFDTTWLWRQHQPIRGYCLKWWPWWGLVGLLQMLILQSLR